jgi:hypothetical protein
MSIDDRLRGGRVKLLRAIADKARGLVDRFTNAFRSAPADDTRQNVKHGLDLSLLDRALGRDPREKKITGRRLQFRTVYWWSIDFLKDNVKHGLDLSLLDRALGRDPREKKITGRRLQFRTVYWWSIDFLKDKLSVKQPFFRMRSGGVYTLQMYASGPRKGQFTGAFVRVDKDRRPVKVRKAWRRDRREHIANLGARATPAMSEA